MNEIKTSKLFPYEQGQAIRVPEGFELPGTEITVTKQGNRLIVEPVAGQAGPQSWAEFLATLEPVDVEWPDIDEGLLPVDDVNLE